MWNDISFDELENPFSKDLPPLVIAKSINYPNLQFSGKGLDGDTRFLSAVGELIERIVMHEVRADRIMPFCNLPNQISPYKFYIEKNVQNSAVEWLEVIEKKTAKKFLVHRPIRHSKIAKYFDHTSNGCSIGPNPKFSLEKSFGEVYERHNFLSAWYFNNLEIQKLDSGFSTVENLKQLGWNLENYLVKSEYNIGTSCALLYNQSDKRFKIGGAVIGLCYGNSERSFVSALAECLQAIEIFLINGIKDPSLDYYLTRSDGGDILKSFFALKNDSSLKEIKTGNEYYFTKTVGVDDLPSYVEAFVEYSLPMHLNFIKNERIPDNLKNQISQISKVHPLPIG